MKKILIFSNHGNLPDAVAEILKSVDDKRTGIIIDKIETITFCVSDADSVVNACRENPNRLVKVNSPINKNFYEGRYFGWCDQIKWLSCVNICEIDETKRWVIEEYDGAESIREIPAYECCNAELNLWKEIERG